MKRVIDSSYKVQGYLQSLNLKDYSSKKKQEAKVKFDEFCANVDKRNQESINEFFPANEDIPEQLSH